MGEFPFDAAEMYVHLAAFSGLIDPQSSFGAGFVPRTPPRAN
jgi:hypothetical protein